MAFEQNARDIKLDLITGDLADENGDLLLVSGTDAIRQSIDLHLSLIKGEWFLDESLGIPYFEQILGKRLNLIAVRQIFRKELTLVPGVKEILSFDLSYVAASRTIKISFNVSTDVGALISTLEIQPL